MDTEALYAELTAPQAEADSARAQIADAIMEQLGGHRFRVMTGARNFVAHPWGLTFKLPARFAKDGINFVRVVLDPNDTYSLTFMRTRGTSCVEVSWTSDIYCDQLQELFTDRTGLRTTL